MSKQNERMSRKCKLVVANTAGNAHGMRRHAMFERIKQANPVANLYACSLAMLPVHSVYL